MRSHLQTPSLTLGLPASPGRRRASAPRSPADPGAILRRHGRAVKKLRVLLPQWATRWTSQNPGRASSPLGERADWDLGCTREGFHRLSEAPSGYGITQERSGGVSRPRKGQERPSESLSEAGCRPAGQADRPCPPPDLRPQEIAHAALQQPGRVLSDWGNEAPCVGARRYRPPLCWSLYRLCRCIAGMLGHRSANRAVAPSNDKVADSFLPRMPHLAARAPRRLCVSGNEETRADYHAYGQPVSKHWIVLRLLTKLFGNEEGDPDGGNPMRALLRHRRPPPLRTLRIGLDFHALDAKGRGCRVPICELDLLQYFHKEVPIRWPRPLPSKPTVAWCGGSALVSTYVERRSSTKMNAHKQCPNVIVPWHARSPWSATKLLQALQLQL